ncbi:MAG: hypothetical protein KKB90_04520 [Actinobacteria bacterium]|nr:hypothetical protein [Actinomycetota bacterium]MCG2818600.1 hypothetical protein [Actinomycetes bacterium]MBU4179755.1 hypothetical protein [Actinomycetota bacterium]MBU4218211.1 hypothetical protein [Actinomycetota bacterium]MBU4358636.1 hypothetical protein [Actinomycetota bacterium]
MRKIVVLFVVLFLAVGVMAVVGCGNGEESDDAVENVEGDEEGTISLDEPVSEGIVGTFIEGVSTSDAEGKKTVTFVAEGTFEGDAWDASKSGKYEVEEGEYTFVVLTFDDGTTEKWSVMIGNGKVYALGSPGGDQYTKK